MKRPRNNGPDLERLRGVVAPEVLTAVEIASAQLRQSGIPHALAGDVALGAYGYPCSSDVVDFLVGDEAFVKHAGGIVTLKLPLIAVGDVRVDFVSIDESRGEAEQLRPAVENPPTSENIPIVPLPALVYMKLKANRLKDIADLVELVKRGKVEVAEIDHYLAQHAEDLVPRWERVKETARREE
jgi:hypothetical protein